MREVSRTSTGVWYESDGGGFFQLPYPPAASEFPAPTLAQQVEWGLRYIRERYGETYWLAHRGGDCPDG